MNAVQLKDPAGVVRGWMCGRCFHPSASVSSWASEADEGLIALWRQGAERCCTCLVCRAPAHHVRGIRCEACAASHAAETERANAAEDERRTAELGGPTVECPECCGFSGIDEDTDCTRCDDRGYVLASTVTPATEDGR